ncbi:hypothetical protein WJX72_005830 [[Myrmecia] bisecta]|uniref:Uncharacterized protein n=1 Tax=[Myrmecia] bisecta TaxID=41462 RepID=A0AAW1PCQ2_9CHLO
MHHADAVQRAVEHVAFQAGLDSPGLGQLPWTYLGTLKPVCSYGALGTHENPLQVEGKPIAGPATLPPLGLDDARQLLLQDYRAYFSMGKTTALLELWPRLYQLAQPVEGTEAGQEQDDVLYARIRRSMRPDCMMVFALDLQQTDLARLHHLEVPLGSDNPTILALRMLYSSVCQLGPWEDYGRFLMAMRPQLRESLQPLDVLHFWQAAAGVGDAEHWLAAFTLDEVGAAQPEPKPDQPSWVQHALANFVHLRPRGLSCRRFEDLENDGLAYIGQPGGPDLETGGSGDSTGRRASTDSDDVNDPGSTNPDAGEQQSGQDIQQRHVPHPKPIELGLEMGRSIQ